MTARVCHLILLTQHGSPAAPPLDPEDTDARLLLDIDLSILGTEDPAAFAAYDAGIAVEYAHVPPDAYRSGRRKVLQHFLEAASRPLGAPGGLFLSTTPAAARWQTAALRNLAAAVAALS